MKLSKAQKRDRKRTNKRKMIVDGKGVFTIEEVIKKRADKIKSRKKKQRRKEE